MAELKDHIVRLAGNENGSFAAAVCKAFDRLYDEREGEQRAPDNLREQSRDNLFARVSSALGSLQVTDAAIANPAFDALYEIRSRFETMTRKAPAPKVEEVHALIMSIANDVTKMHIDKDALAQTARTAADKLLRIRSPEAGMEVARLRDDVMRTIDLALYPKSDVGQMVDRYFEGCMLRLGYSGVVRGIGDKIVGLTTASPRGTLLWNERPVFGIDGGQALEDTKRALAAVIWKWVGEETVHDGSPSVRDVTLTDRELVDMHKLAIEWIPLAQGGVRLSVKHR